MHPLKSATGLGLIALAGLTACGGGDDDDDAQKLPQLSAASAGTLSACATLLTGFTDANTTLTAATDVAAGTLTVGGTAVPAHCQVTGNMYSRTGSNGNYAIGFEMRLPQAWNGRFFYQANGGTDGAIGTAARAIAASSSACTTSSSSDTAPVIAPRELPVAAAPSAAPPAAPISAPPATACCMRWSDSRR